MAKKAWRERNRAWSIEPKGNAVNESMSAEMAANVRADAEISHGVICADGEPHNLLWCEKSLCTALSNSYKVGKDFEVWYRATRDAKIRKVSFLFKRRRKRLPSKAYRDMPITT